MITSLAARTCLTLSITAASAAAVAADVYTVVDLTELIPGATDAAAFDVSDSGLVAGTARVAFGDSQVALWTATSAQVLDSVFGSELTQGVSNGGTMVGSYLGTATGWFYRDGVFDCIPLPDPCGSFNNIWRASSGRAINDADVFTGAISPPAGTPQGDPVQAYLGRFADNGDVVIERLGTFGGASTAGVDLNDDEVVVGVSGSSLDWVALLFRDGGVERLPDLGGSYNWAEGINDRGFAVGIASAPGATVWPYPAEGLLWDTSATPITFHTLGHLAGDLQLRPLDLNNRNQVVGTSIGAGSANQRAFLWDDGGLVDLNQLLPAGSDWTLEAATAINESGAIVGSGRRAGISGQRAFLLRPQPMFAATFDGGGLGEWSSTRP